jgi:hypothetical protein
MRKLGFSVSAYRKLKPFIELLFLILKNFNNPFSVFIKNLEVKSKLDQGSLKYRTGIVIQGSISDNLEQIKKNLKFYNLNFPELKIVVSTWDEEVKAVEEIKNLFIGEIILNPKPTNPGPSNINLQIMSTFSGLEKLKELGVERAIKVRSDLSHMNQKCLILLETRMELAKKLTDSYQNRIVTIAMNNFVFRLFGISDLFQYGNIQDLQTYWNIPLDSRTPKSPDYIVERSIVESSKMKFTEVYLFTHYLERNSFKIEWNLKTSIEALLKFTIPINALELGLYWNKYSYLAQRFSLHRNNWKFEEFDLNTWLYFTLNPSKLDEISKIEYLVDNVSQ